MRRVARAVVALVQVVAIAAVAFTAMWTVWAAYKAALWLLLFFGHAVGACDYPPVSLLEAVTTFVPGPPAC